MSNDGKSVLISDEYGPYVYQFNRTTGKRMKAFKLPDYFAVTNLRALASATGCRFQSRQWPRGLNNYGLVAPV